MTRETIHEIMVEVHFFDDDIEALEFINQEQAEDCRYGEGEIYEYDMTSIEKPW